MTAIAHSFAQSIVNLAAFMGFVCAWFDKNSGFWGSFLRRLDPFCEVEAGLAEKFRRPLAERQNLALTLRLCAHDAQESQKTARKELADVRC